MFNINGVEWDIIYVKPNSRNLFRSDGTVTVAVTDWNDKCIYLSDALYGAFLRRVVAHELCHCFCFSYNISMPLEEEERLADWISLYGTELVYLLDDLIKILRRVA